MKPSNGLFDKEIPAIPLVETIGRTWHSPAALSLCATYGTKDPTKAVCSLAQALVAESGLRKPADNLPLLASIQDIVAIKPCAMTDAGRLLPTESGLIINVNECHSTTRQNFSACHEITHTLIPAFCAGPKRKIDASTGLYAIDTEEEYLCDLGASEILLPVFDLIRALNGFEPSVAMVTEIATEFCASFEATSIRLVRLNIADFGLIVWEPSWKPSQMASMAEPSLFEENEVSAPVQKLRVRYACCSGSMAQHYFPRSKSIDEFSLVGQTFATSQATSGHQELTTGSGPKVFRTDSISFRFWHNDVLEQKVLTLVFPP